MNVLVVVPARGGSKALPGKNLLPVGGLSLTARAVRTGRQFVRRARLEGAVVLVDTDDPAIAAEGRRYGAEVPFLRPPALACDDTPTWANVLACVDRLTDDGRFFDVVVLLQPTSPLRVADDIIACWHAFQATSALSVVAVTPLEHPTDLAVRITRDGILEWVTEGGRPRRRQETEAAFRISGAVYIARTTFLREHRAFTVAGLSAGVQIPNARSIDVDTADDLAAAEAMARMDAGTTRSVPIADKIIGGGESCFIIAEAGVNHNGDPALAHQLIDAAADAGANAVKFQTFEPTALASPDARQAAYQTTNTGINESQLSMLSRLVLPIAEYQPLQAHAAERGILFLSTPFDEPSADFLEQLDMPAFKIPSGELTNHPFLAHVARKGRPMLISTGMATMAEIAEAIDTVEKVGPVPLALFHCVTDYPADPSICNLSAMATMRQAFRVPVGWSDHTMGIEVAIAAAAHGAELIEKHFTLDRALPGPDQKTSLEPHELAALVRAIRLVEAARGSGRKEPAAIERSYAAVVRKSLHARGALPCGHILRTEDVIALRPAGGLPPGDIGKLIGRRVRAPIRAGARLAEHDFV